MPYTPRKQLVRLSTTIGGQPFGMLCWLRTNAARHVGQRVVLPEVPEQIWWVEAISSKKRLDSQRDLAAPSAA